MRLHLVPIGALLVVVAGLHAQPLKPRQAIDKPARTKLDGASHHSDRVYVKFQDDSNVRIRGGELTDDGAGALAPASPLLQRLTRSGATWRRQHTLPEERLTEMRRAGERNTGKAMPDLNTAYILHVPPGLDGAAVIDELNALPSVEIALPVPLPASPPVAPDYQERQDYLDPATTNGVNALHAWTIPGGNGARIVDIEYAWNLNHIDISATLIGPTPVVPAVEIAAGAGSHGTAVLGIMGGLNDGVGVTGIAWGSTYSVAAANTASGYDIAAAITTALATSGRATLSCLSSRSTDRVRGTMIWSRLNGSNQPTMRSLLRLQTR